MHMGARARDHKHGGGCFAHAHGLAFPDLTARALLARPPKPLAPDREEDFRRTTDRPTPRNRGAHVLPQEHQPAPELKEASMTVRVSMTVNGKAVSGDVEERTLLVEFIRNNLRLTGTHVGCDTAQCGACTIHMNGRAVKSCNMLAMQAEGAQLTTIEGVAKADGTLHPMQEAFREHHGLQCGFCTPGMIMSAIDLVTVHPKPDEQTIRAELDGNLCRCTGYHNIVKAIKAAASRM
jgi:carbon-monoxide dehydrogenase small subunit